MFSITLVEFVCRVTCLYKKNPCVTDKSHTYTVQLYEYNGKNSQTSQYKTKQDWTKKITNIFHYQNSDQLR